MKLSRLNPMNIGWFTAIAAALIVLPLLYFVEELRQSQVDLSKEPLSELTEEEKEVVRKKIKRPEPKPEQVEEIARQQKEKKEEEMRKNVRKLKQTVYEMEEEVEARMKDLRKLGLGDRIDALVVAIARQTEAVKDEADAGEAFAGAARSHAADIQNQSLQLADIHRDLIEAAGPTGRLGDLRRMLPAAESIRLLAAGEMSLPPEVGEDIRPFREDVRKKLEQIERDSEKLIALIPAAIEEAMAEAERLVEEHPELRELAEKLPEEAPSDPLRELMKEMELEAEDIAEDLQSQQAMEELEDVDAAALAEQLQSMAEQLAGEFETSDFEPGGMSQPLADYLDSEEFQARFEEYLAQMANLPEDSAIAAADAGQLYEMSEQMSEQFDQLNAEARAAEMAAIQNQSFEQAMENPFMPPGGFPPMSEAAQSGEMPQTMEQFREFNQALAEAVGQTENAALRAENQLGRMQPPDPQTGRPMPQASSTMMRAQMATAAADRGFVDFSQMMATGHQGEFLQDLSKQVDPRYGSIPATGAAAAPIPTSRQAPVKISNERALTEAIPARIVRPEGERRGWLFIDTWYIIGPWGQKGGSLRPPLPPETLVDLDATYSGREMRGSGERAELEWRFVQSNTVRVTPPDETTRAVYFAYTELFFEEETTALLAVATDDWSKLWLNDMLILQDTSTSTWTLSEHFRKVTFRQGVNTFLLRLENGQGRCNFSIIFVPLSAE